MDERLLPSEPYAELALIALAHVASWVNGSRKRAEVCESAAVTALPPESVLRAFGLVGDVEVLTGGWEASVLVDGVVLKRVMNLEVAHFCQQTLSTVDAEDMVVPAPVQTNDGEWSFEGWTATEFIDGLTSARRDPALLIDVGRRFAAVLERRIPIDDAAVRARSDRWAMADRYAWREADISLSPNTQRVAEKLWSRVDDRAGPPVLIHADLAGNVFLVPDGTPVVLDFTPVFRPVSFQRGIVIADTLLWGDLLWGDRTLEHVALLEGATSSLARGLLFRLAAAELGPGPDNADLARCRAVIADLGWA